MDSLSTSFSGRRGNDAPPQFNVMSSRHRAAFFIGVTTMFNVLTTILACVIFGMSFTQVDGGYLFLIGYALGAFILGAVLAHTIND